MEPALIVVTIRRLNRFQGVNQDGSYIIDGLEASQSGHVGQVKNVTPFQRVIEPQPAVVFRGSPWNGSGDPPMPLTVPVVDGHPALEDLRSVDSGVIVFRFLRRDHQGSHRICLVSHVQGQIAAERALPKTSKTSQDIPPRSNPTGPALVPLQPDGVLLVW